MAEQQLTLTAEERAFLTELLEGALKDMQIEEHRTRAPSYRKLVLEQEAVVSSVLNKLKQAPI